MPALQRAARRAARGDVDLGARARRARSSSTVEIGRTTMTIRETLEIGPRLDRRARPDDRRAGRPARQRPAASPAARSSRSTRSSACASRTSSRPSAASTPPPRARSTAAAPTPTVRRPAMRRRAGATRRRRDGRTLARHRTPGRAAASRRRRARTVRRAAAATDGRPPAFARRRAPALEVRAGALTARARCEPVAVRDPGRRRPRCHRRQPWRRCPQERVSRLGGAAAAAARPSRTCRSAPSACGGWRRRICDTRDSLTPSMRPISAPCMCLT